MSSKRKGSSDAAEAPPKRATATPSEVRVPIHNHQRAGPAREPL